MPANSADLVQQSKQAIASPAMQHYFVRFEGSYNRAKKRMDIAQLEALGDDAELHGEFWQNFWEELPDGPSIRGTEFDVVCELAEWYCFGDR